MIRAQEGFSLAETALSLAILGVVIGALVPGIMAMRGAEQSRATQTRLEAVMRAASSFAEANGCFPCPTPSTAQGGAGRGMVRGDSSANAALCNGCFSPAVGLVPYRALGLPESFARDGYGRWLTYAVDAALTPNLGERACKTVSDGCDASDVSHSLYKKGFCAVTRASGNPLSVAQIGGGAQHAAIIVISHGPNGRGAYTEGGAATNNAFPASQPACSAGASGAERCNGDGNLVFVQASPSKNDDAFDDQLLYFDRNALLSLTGATCATAW